MEKTTAVEDKMMEVNFMEDKYYCPHCSHELECMKGCGSVSYFCSNCKKLVSRKEILTEEQIVAKVRKKVIENLGS